MKQLFILGGNPVYDTRRRTCDFLHALGEGQFRRPSFASTSNETSATLAAGICRRPISSRPGVTFSLATAHPAILQPVIVPTLRAARSAHELLALMLLGGLPAPTATRSSARNLARQRALRPTSRHSGSKSIHDGVVKASLPESLAARPRVGTHDVMARPD